MNTVKEIEKRDRRIENDKKKIAELKEEIVALRQLLDCAAANMIMLVREKGGSTKISMEEVSELLGKYRLGAKRDGEGNYILEIQRENE